MHEDYLAYKTAKINTKKIIKSAKIKSWQEYGEMLNKDRQNAPKMFYKKVQNMRSKKDTNQQK